MLLKQLLCDAATHFCVFTNGVTIASMRGGARGHSSRSRRQRGYLFLLWIWPARIAYLCSYDLCICINCSIIYNTLVHYKEDAFLHPQTQLSGCRTRSYPIHCRMEFGYRRHSGDALATQLRQLLSLACIHVDKAVHVADAEALDVVAGELLPLGS